jgi:hypothetical protein
MMDQTKRIKFRLLKDSLIIACQLLKNNIVALDIAAALKSNHRLWKKNRYLASCSFRGKMSCLRSRHLVLWSL